MNFDISRDFLDGIMLQHPPQPEGNKEVKANGGLHFLPSSPDGTMHTAIVSFALQLEGQGQPFAKAGWRFLFTSDQKWDPKGEQNHPFLGQLLILGASKVVTVMNNLCLHANMPMMPISPERLAQQMQRPAGAAAGEAPQNG
jgi:hypothetical protein